MYASSPPTIRFTTSLNSPLPWPQPVFTCKYTGDMKYLLSSSSIVQSTVSSTTDLLTYWLAYLLTYLPTASLGKHVKYSSMMMMMMMINDITSPSICAHCVPTSHPLHIRFQRAEREQPAEPTTHHPSSVNRPSSITTPTILNGTPS